MRLSQPLVVILECVVALGLERRLRRYEFVSDVKSSWNQDEQDSLRIDNSERDTASAPPANEPLGESFFLLYY